MAMDRSSMSKQISNAPTTKDKNKQKKTDEGSSAEGARKAGKKKFCTILSWEEIHSQTI